MSGVMLPDCLIALLPSCIQKIIKDITSNIYLINFLQNMNRFVCDVIRYGLLIVCATLCLCIWEHCIIYNTSMQ